MQCPQDELQIELAHYRENFKRGMGNEEWFVEERNKRSEVIVRKKKHGFYGRLIMVLKFQCLRSLQVFFMRLLLLCDYIRLALSHFFCFYIMI
jgi:hypothetical protein